MTALTCSSSWVSLAFAVSMRLNSSSSRMKFSDHLSVPSSLVLGWPSGRPQEPTRDGPPISKTIRSKLAGLEVSTVQMLLSMLVMWQVMPMASSWAMMDWAAFF